MIINRRAAKRLFAKLLFRNSFCFENCQFRKFVPVEFIYTDSIMNFPANVERTSDHKVNR